MRLSFSNAKEIIFFQTCIINRHHKPCKGPKNLFSDVCQPPPFGGGRGERPLSFLNAKLRGGCPIAWDRIRKSLLFSDFFATFSWFSAVFGAVLPCFGLKSALFLRRLLHELVVNVHDICGEICQCFCLYCFGHAPDGLGHAAHDSPYGVAIATHGDGIA